MYENCQNHCHSDNYRSAVSPHSSFESPTARASRFNMQTKKHLSILTVIHLSAGDYFLPDTVYIRLTHHPHHYFRYTAATLNNILRSSLV
jgi:hypothetical protein